MRNNSLQTTDNELAFSYLQGYRLLCNDLCWHQKVRKCRHFEIRHKEQTRGDAKTFSVKASNTLPPVCSPGWCSLSWVEQAEPCIKKNGTLCTCSFRSMCWRIYRYNLGCLSTGDTVICPLEVLCSSPFAQQVIIMQTNSAVSYQCTCSVWMHDTLHCITPLGKSLRAGTQRSCECGSQSAWQPLTSLLLGLVHVHWPDPTCQAPRSSGRDQAWSCVETQLQSHDTHALVCGGGGQDCAVDTKWCSKTRQHTLDARFQRDHQFKETTFLRFGAWVTACADDLVIRSVP